MARALNNVPLIHHKATSIACAGVAGLRQSEQDRVLASGDAVRWWDILCAPAMVTRFLIFAAPSSAKAEVAGVSLSLRCYDARRLLPSQQPETAAAAASSSHAVPTAAPFSLGLPALTGAAQSSRAGAAADETLPFRRRKRLRAVVPQATASLSSATQSEGPAAAPRVLQRDCPVEEHVLVQQWGFSLAVQVLPPLWSELEPRETAPERKLAHEQKSSVYTNPLYASEETSTSSYSDTSRPICTMFMCILPCLP